MAPYPQGAEVIPHLKGNLGGAEVFPPLGRVSQHTVLPLRLLGMIDDGNAIAPFGRDILGDPVPDPGQLRPLLPSQEQWEDKRFSNLAFIDEFVERCGSTRALDLYAVGVPAEDPWSRLITYDKSPHKYRNIPDIPHVRQLASYMWDMVEFGFQMMGRNLDFLAAEGFRLDSAVSMILDHAKFAP